MDSDSSDFDTFESINLLNTSQDDVEMELSIEFSRGRELSPPKKTLSRWRQRNAHNHKREKNKRRRNLGMPYIGSKKEEKPPRTMGPPCSCKKECRKYLLGKELDIFNAFWDIGNYDKQNIHLSSRIQFHEPKQRRPLHKTAKPFSRNFVFQYTLQIGGQQIEVCKNEFLAVHGLQSSKKRVDLICKQLKNGSIIPKADGRGKHKNHRKYKDTTLNYVREHINAVPKYTSHYSRNSNPNKVYLDCDMSINELYRKYRGWLQDKRNSVHELDPNDEALKYMIAVSSDKYRRIFCTEFKIGFKLPRSDTCKDCDKFIIDLKCNKSDATLTAKLKQEQLSHHILADEMKEDLKTTSQDAKISKKYDVASVDLQQTLPTPSLTVGVAFYKRKAWTYNLGLHDCVADKGYMYLWPENVALRGSEEVMSCVLKHFTVNRPSSPGLIVYSDNCSGQNKNWNFIGLWMLMVYEGFYETIEHRFPVPGHTRLPCDRDFGIIENHKKRVGQVYTPEGWAKLIKESNRKNPFSVTMMKREDFYCFEGITDYIEKKTKTDDKKAMQFMKARCFKVTNEDQNVLYVKHALNDEFKSVTITKGGRGSFTPCREQLFPKYDDDIPLQAKKIIDLRELLQYIPLEDRAFFEDIFKNKCTEDDDDPLNVEHL